MKCVEETSLVVANQTEQCDINIINSVNAQIRNYSGCLFAVKWVPKITQRNPTAMVRKEKDSTLFRKRTRAVIPIAAVHR